MMCPTFLFVMICNLRLHELTRCVMISRLAPLIELPLMRRSAIYGVSQFTIM